MEPRVIPISRRPAAARARVWSLQTDSVLCRAASHGNELAFNELYRRHRRALRAFVFHFLGAHHRHEDADDIVQDAFVRAFDAIAEQRFTGEFRHWLFAIARNRSIDLLRGERVRLVSLDSAAVEIGPQAAGEETTPPAVAETRDEMAWLVHALEQLPERQRSALLLRELAGLSHEAIAEELETTTGSARQLITRARDGVREAAQRDGREHAIGRKRGLRNELMDSVPMVPLAAAGIVATAGSTTAGSFAFGKLVATVFAAIVLAGTAGTVTHEISDASGAPGHSEKVGSVPASSMSNGAQAPTSGSDRRGSGAHSKSRFSDGVPGGSTKTDAAPKTPHSPSSSTNSGDGSDAQGSSGEHSPPAKSTPALPTPQPVKQIVDLPGKAVEHVADGLNGSSPPDQVVGDVVGDVVGTLGDVTTGLLGSDSGSH